MKRPEIIEREARGKNGKGETHRFENPGEYDKVTSDPKNLWVRHDIQEAFRKELKKRGGKDSYEDFIYGFMYHFDNFSGKEKWDIEKDGPHKLYFKWNEDKGEVKSVEIFIIPAPIDPFKGDSMIVNTIIDPEKPPAPPPPPANP